MKKRTLNQTWILCLRMWRWIVKMKAKHPRRWVSTLKKQWLRENRIKIVGNHNCFFCEFINDNIGCGECPARLIDISFSCHRIGYHHIRKPAAFYKELLRLNRIRKAKKWPPND